MSSNEQNVLEVFAQIMEQAGAGNGAPSKRTAAVNEREIMSRLAELGGGQVGESDVVFGGDKIQLPTSVSKRQAMKILEKSIKSDEEMKDFHKTFNYRPWDGAYNLFQALRETFGSAGFGQAIQTMFGEIKPAEITIKTGIRVDSDGLIHDVTEQVPWGQFEFPHLQAVINTSGQMHPERGPLFSVTFTAPARFGAQIQGFFKVLEERLRLHSIYRGKAFDGATEPSFLNTKAVDRRKVAYTETVEAQLEANVWAMMRHTKTFEKLGLPLKRAVLLEGPYGTGKSLAAGLTSDVAVQNGWTFIQCRPGKDNLASVMQTAMLYQPAVVFYEDIDTLAETSDPLAISKLLDMFDGITAKGTKLLMVLTTNSLEKIHKGMMRPGRLDAQIRIEALDGPAKEKLIRASVPEELLADDVDFGAIDHAMEGYLPAFIKEAIDRAQYYAIARSGGVPDKLTTHDFVLAAEDLRPQYLAMQAAAELKPRPVLGEAFKDLVTDVVNEIKFVDHDGNAQQVGHAHGLAVKPESD
jgi:transitional endoplasmic reticulum ATPase